MVEPHVRQLAERLLNTGFDALPEREQRVIARIARRVHISQNLNVVLEERRTYGERLADQVAAFGGSWTFIIMFGTILVAWVALNSFLLAGTPEAFDSYPYIFLNLILSMLAALQAPVIMMSQNRQAAKDRVAAGHDYEVNLKAELEILALHEKLDQMRTDQLTTLLRQQLTLHEKLDQMRTDQLTALLRQQEELLRLIASGKRAEI
jgi:uncharacterized membrane protein